MTAPQKHRAGAASLLWNSAVLALATALICFCELAVLFDVRGWSSRAALRQVNAYARANITPINWLAYVVVLVALLGVVDGGSYLAARWNRLLVCWLVSVPLWCFFDWINFYFMRDPATHLPAWDYVGLPEYFGDRVIGYMVAFGAICPGMFLTAELLMRTPLARLPLAPLRIPPALQRLTLALGAAFLLAPFLLPDPIATLMLWVSLTFLLDPLNFWLGRPSLMGDWRAGRWSRTLSLMAAGLFCGFLWEFWNFWATSKWHYHLPFLGAWEKYKIFEMPVLGFFGFAAFGPECWVVWQFALLLLGPFVEGERSLRPDPVFLNTCCC